MNTAAASVADVHAYCQQRAAASGSSFYYAFRYLPDHRRRAITAFYAFCREVDDIADECHDNQVARAKLAWWREEIARLYADRPQHPVTRALRDGVHMFELPRSAFEEIIAGMEMDLGHVRYDTFKDLFVYCHRVAGVVGEVSALIFGVSDEATLKYAHCLGVAMQLTNILRDVGEDLRRDRIYLPREEMALYAVTLSDLTHPVPSHSFRELMKFQYQRARAYYREAESLLPAADRKAQLPGLIMAAIYRRLLDEIRRNRFRVLDRRIALSPLTKLWLAWTTWLKG